MMSVPRRLSAWLLCACLLAPAGAVAETRLVVLGDSLSAGYGLEAGAGFPERLEARLRAAGHPVSVINAGVSGDTSAGGRARLDWTLGDAPDAVIVELGGNDALRGLDPRQTRTNLAAILARLREARIPTLLAGMRAPRNLGDAYSDEFDRVYPQLAAEYQVLFYPFFLAGVAGDPTLNQPDGIHPNARGVEHIVTGVFPLVVELLRQVPAGR